MESHWTFGMEECTKDLQKCFPKNDFLSRAVIILLSVMTMTHQ